MTELEARADARAVSGPDDVRVMVASKWLSRDTEEGTVRTLVRPGYEQQNGRAKRPGLPLSLSKRTRWLTFVNERGSVVMAPGVRTHQLSLLFGMGKEWYARAMVFPDGAAKAVLDQAARIVGENTVNLIGAPL